MPILGAKGAASVGGFGFNGGFGPCLIVATGGDSVVDSGDFRTHIFTGTGNFAVKDVKAASSGKVDYMVIAGGGSTGGDYGAGAGAGGFRISNHPASGIPSPTMSPLVSTCGVTVTAQTYPITVGAGGAGATTNPAQTSGGVSTFASITSAGGGKGGSSTPGTRTAGGSGGGHVNQPGPQGAAGNTPPTSPSQGFPGGSSGNNSNNQGAGGGAAQKGQNTADSGPATSPTSGTRGGDGSFIADTFIGPTAPSYGEAGPVGSTRYFAGGGAGASDTPQTNAVGGVGGGGDGNRPPNSPACTSRTAGSTNMGGGAGGGPGSATFKNGGSGIVMLRYKFQ